jgi:hypothetical protein
MSTIYSISLLFEIHAQAEDRDRKYLLWLVPVPSRQGSECRIMANSNPWSLQGAFIKLMDTTIQYPRLRENPFGVCLSIYRSVNSLLYREVLIFPSLHSNQKPAHTSASVSPFLDLRAAQLCSSSQSYNGHRYADCISTSYEVDGIISPLDPLDPQDDPRKSALYGVDTMPIPVVHLG